MSGYSDKEILQLAADQKRRSVPPVMKFPLLYDHVNDCIVDSEGETIAELGGGGCIADMQYLIESANAAWKRSPEKQ